MKINERIALLRKQKGCTQEQLADYLGVTNQSVSKWESAQCCPDIQLLPQIAAFFGVSVDSLMGCAPSEGLDELCLRIREYFAAQSEESCMEDCCRIAALLHEAALSKGFRNKLPWETRDYAKDAMADWGTSIQTDAHGVAARRGNSLFFSLEHGQKMPTNYQLRLSAAQFALLGDPDVLAVLCALDICTSGDDARHATAMEIAKTAHVSEETARAALEQLPVDAIEIDDERMYRLADGFQHIAPILRMTFAI